MKVNRGTTLRDSTVHRTTGCVIAATLLLGRAAVAAEGWPGVAFWGSDSNGQGLIPGGVVPVRMSAGGASIGVVLSDGTVRCWGRNDNGQCDVPASATNVVQLAVGSYHMVALRDDGAVVCWGSNAQGQCTPPGKPATYLRVSAGDAHTLAVRSDGVCAAWGSNNYGQTEVPSNLQVVDDARAGAYHSIAILPDRRVQCWGRNDSGQCSSPAELASVSSAAGGDAHSIALRFDGSVVCWGQNSNGQCTVPAGLGPVVEIAAGWIHSVALLQTGQVVCWGANNSGQTSVPAELANASMIAASGYTSYAWADAYRHPARAVLPDETTLFVSSNASRLLAGTQASTRIECTGGMREAFSMGPGRTVHCLDDMNLVGNITVDFSVSSEPSMLVVEGSFEASGFLRAAGASQIAIANDLVLGDYIDLQISNLTTVAGQVTINKEIAVRGNAQLTADGRIQAGGFGYGSSSATIRSTAPLGVLPAISMAGLAEVPVTTEARGMTLVTNPIPISGLGSATVPDMVTRGPLQVKGVVGAASSGQVLHLQADQDPDLALLDPSIEFLAGNAIELNSNNRIITRAPGTTLFSGAVVLRSSSTIETDADLAIGGDLRIPVNTAISLLVGRVDPSDKCFDVREGGDVIIENGGSLQIAPPSTVVVSGDLTVDQQGLFSLVGGVDRLEVRANGETRCFGGTVRADELVVLGALAGADDDAGRVLGVNGLLDVDVLRVRGGAMSFADSSLVGDLVTEPQPGGAAAASITASGQFFGGVDNAAGRITAIGDLVIVGDVDNGTGGTLVAQIGTMYIAGSLANDGSLYGNIVTAPGYGGDAGTGAGDGLRVGGSLSVGSEGSIRFSEDLWRLGVCGDVSIACPTSEARLEGATLALDGCASKPQRLEVTSRDHGCIAAPFGGEQSDVTLIGQLAIEAGATVELVDQFDNDGAAGVEAVYAGALRVAEGSTLVTNGIMVYTRQAAIAGSVDDPSRICVLPEPPDADINDDGLVNGQDLTFVLGFWNSANPLGDLNEDGIVNALDLAIVLVAWTGG